MVSVRWVLYRTWCLRATHTQNQVGSEQMSRDTYIVCSTHGDLYVHRNSQGNYPRAQALEPLRGDVKQPAAGDAMVCPLCKSRLTFEHRATPSENEPNAPA